MNNKFTKGFCDSIALYKYVIEQGIVTAKVRDLKEKLLQKRNQFFQIDGRSLHISSIFFDMNNNKIFVQFHVDIEIDDREDLLEHISEKMWDDFSDFIYNAGLYMVYTGGRGFHVYSKYPVLIKGINFRNYNPKELKEKVFKEYGISPVKVASKIGGRSDNNMSITKTPTIRLGWRKEKKNFAVPLIREFGLDTYSIVKFLCQRQNNERKQKLLENIFGNSRNFQYLVDKYLMPCE